MNSFLKGRNLFANNIVKNLKNQEVVNILIQKTWKFNVNWDILKSRKKIETHVMPVIVQFLNGHFWRIPY